MAIPPTTIKFVRPWTVLMNPSIIPSRSASSISAGFTPNCRIKIAGLARISLNCWRSAGIWRFRESAPCPEGKPWTSSTAIASQISWRVSISVLGPSIITSRPVKKLKNRSQFVADPSNSETAWFASAIVFSRLISAKRTCCSSLIRASFSSKSSKSPSANSAIFSTTVCINPRSEATPLPWTLPVPMLISFSEKVSTVRS